MLEQGLNLGFDFINPTEVIRPILTPWDSALIVNQLVKQDDKSSTGSFICINFLFQLLKITLFPQTATGFCLTLSW